MFSLGLPVPTPPGILGGSRRVRAVFRLRGYGDHNEAPVSDLIIKLGYEKCQKIDSKARQWLDKNGLKYDLFHNENG